jgi:hypothetical protein
MKTFRLGLSFLEVKEGELPGPPRAHVYVKNFCAAAFKSIEGAPLISHECVSFEEFDYQIDELQKELDALRADARRRFTAVTRREEERWARKQGGRK